MRTTEIRKRWLDFFASKDHHIAESVSLVSPDPDLLFTIAGMVPFIPYFLGEEKSPYPRIASVQKCIRTGDIENVGRTTRHGTFFQMNGNFSFGDYFKAGAIDYAWELLTNPQDQGGYGFDGDKFWVTIWDEDKESYDTLTKKIGIDPRQVVQLPRKQNFWDTGQPGPAGPCAEWHYDRGPKYGPDAVGGNVDPGGDRYLEIWNLVFDQFVRGPGIGKDYPLLGELDQTGVDTGAGLERIAFLLQNKENFYEIDEVFPVIQTVEQITGKKYGANPADDIQMRVVADHVRAGLMVINDGVRPANEGRGYVLRRLLRRAVRSMRLLGYDGEALPHLMPVSKDAMKGSYPELVANFPKIEEVAYAEEGAFRRTLANGTKVFENAVAAIKKGQNAGVSTGSTAGNGVSTGSTAGSGVLLNDNATKATIGGSETGATSSGTLDGETAFVLHDTHGFPIDITLEMAAEKGVQVDEAAFRKLMAEQKQRARADALSKKTGHADVRAYEEMVQNRVEPHKFVGYTDHSANVRVTGMLVDGQPSPVVQAPANVEVVLDQTPFYAEMGGQLADQGTIVLDSGAVIEVDDVQAPIKGLSVHRGRLIEGNAAMGDTGVATIDTARRAAISRAHSATHMIHKALHEMVGEDRTQAGSENAPSRVRFDFRSSTPVSTNQLGEIEERVNARLIENMDITDSVMSLDKARAAGAMALFGEKYGDQVRVVNMGDGWSLELCGGTHVKKTGEIGRVALLGEASIGSGVRRVDALVGDEAYGFHAKEHALVNQLTDIVGARPDELADRVAKMMTKLRDTEKELNAVRQARLLSAAGELVAKVPAGGKFAAVTYDAGEVASGDDLRALALDVRSRLGESRPAVVAIGGVKDGRPMICIATNAAGRDAGLRAGDLVRDAAQALGGKGGGKPELAQGGGSDASALPQALAGVSKTVAAAVGA